MGMDVYGNAPSSETGKYFRNNVWWWRPLANYIYGVAPEVAARCQHWHANDGEGLDRADALALANILQSEIDSGRTETYWNNNKSEIATPRRNTAEAAIFAVVDELFGEDAQCSPQQYYFDVENVQEFVNFLRDCGGFRIS
jgi:hypothetical protein